MKISSLLGICFAGIILASCAASTEKESGEYDERAIAQLDVMAETVGALESVSFSVSTWVLDDRRLSDVYFRGPNKMYVHSEGLDSGFEIGYWYNGASLSFYSFARNLYDIVDAPDGIMNAIDFVNREYGIEFPAADFFYPAFTDDIIANYDRVYYIGETVIDDVAAIELEVSNDEEIVGMWIAEETHLPVRMTIRPAGEDDISFDTVLSNWRLNPTLPDAMFEFKPPSESEREQMKRIN